MSAENPHTPETNQNVINIPIEPGSPYGDEQMETVRGTIDVFLREHDLRPEQVFFSGYKAVGNAEKPDDGEHGNDYFFGTYESLFHKEPSREELDDDEIGERWAVNPMQYCRDGGTLGVYSREKLNDDSGAVFLEFDEEFGTAMFEGTRMQIDSAKVGELQVGINSDEALIVEKEGPAVERVLSVAGAVLSELIEDPANDRQREQDRKTVEGYADSLRAELSRWGAMPDRLKREKTLGMFDVARNDKMPVPLRQIFAGAVIGATDDPGLAKAAFERVVHPYLVEELGNGGPESVEKLRLVEGYMQEYQTRLYRHQTRETPAPRLLIEDKLGLFNEMQKQSARLESTAHPSAGALNLLTQSIGAGAVTTLPEYNLTPLQRAQDAALSMI